jgi:hypothetical protein
MHSRVLECFRKCWNTFVQGCKAFDRVGIHLYRVGMLATGLECYRQSWNAFDSVGIPLYRVAMLSTELEYLRTGWECFLECWNVF